jgi:hypothetical protein
MDGLAALASGATSVSGKFNSTTQDFTLNCTL